MSTVSASGHGLAQALARFNRASDALVRGVAGATDSDPVEAIVDIIEAKDQFEANARATTIAEEMTRQLLDIKV